MSLKRSCIKYEVSIFAEPVPPALSKEIVYSTPSLKEADVVKSRLGPLRSEFNMSTFGEISNLILAKSLSSLLHCNLILLLSIRFAFLILKSGLCAKAPKRTENNNAINIFFFKIYSYDI